MPSPIIYLICGSTGAGKTTYAIRLSDRVGAVRFSIDEWMSALYWMDAPKPLEPAWAMERVQRCYSQIWVTARQVAQHGTSCVLDFGFGQRSDRLKYSATAREAGLSVQLHYLDVPAHERWRRIEGRNAQKAETYQLPFDVTREMFDFVESIFESPTEAEIAEINGTVVSWC